MKKIDKQTKVFIGIIMLLVVLTCITINYNNQYTEYNYSLTEMDDGVYAIYYNTHSTVPAQNYEVVILCNEGNVYTFRGKVHISFTDNKPYANVKSYNYVNGDEVHIFVPQGTVDYAENVNISSGSRW